MNKELRDIFNKSIDIISGDNRCLGAWHLDLVSRNLQDEFSDINAVFLINEKDFENFAKDVHKIFNTICDNVIFIYPKEFNSDILKNYGILMQKNSNILQYDLIIINYSKVSNDFCKLYYEDCTEENIIFDKNDIVKTLINNNTKVIRNKEDITNLIYQYMYYLNMTIKYYLSNDYFRILTTKKVLYNTHADLLLSINQKSTWLGIDDLIKNNLSKENKENLLEYFTCSNMENIKESLRKVMDLFFKDAREICYIKEFKYPFDAEIMIRKNFIANME